MDIPETAKEQTEKRNEIILKNWVAMYTGSKINLMEIPEKSESGASA